MNIGPTELLILVFLIALPCVLVARLAATRGRSYALFLVLALLITWPVALVILLIVSQRGTPDELPTPEQPVGAWGVTKGDDSFAAEHEAPRE